MKKTFIFFYLFTFLSIISSFAKFNKVKGSSKVENFSHEITNFMTSLSTGACPTYSEGQIFGHDNSNGDNFFAHYASDGTLYATVDGLALFPPLTRQKLISAGVSVDIANCFADGNKGGGSSAVCSYSQPYATIECINGQKYLSYHLQSVTGSSDTNPILTWSTYTNGGEVFWGTGDKQNIQRLTNTGTPSICTRGSAMFSVKASGCQNIIGDTYTFSSNDCSTCPQSSCTYSQPTSSIQCINGEKHLIFSTNVTGSTNPSGTQWNVSFNNGTGANNVSGDINLTANNLICAGALAINTVSFYANAPGCSNSSGTSSYTFNRAEDCNSCSNNCPTYSNPQWFHWDNASSSLWFAHYGPSGKLYAAVDANPSSPALTRQQLLNSGVNATLANCFSDGTKSSRVASILDETNNELQVYPNPTNNKAKVEFYLQNDENVWLNLYDLHTKSIYIKDFEGKAGKNVVDLELNDYPTGTYFINLQTSEKREVKKVIKVE